MSTRVARSRKLNCARVESSKANQTKAMIPSSSPPSTQTATRTPKGRHVCGRLGAGVRLGPGPGSSPRPASESAGMDVGEQDRPRTDLVEVVHQLLRAVPRDHRAYGDPALAMPRGAGRA